MYEILLGMNILYEIALGMWPLLALLLGVWLVMLWAGRARLGRVAGRQAVLLGVLAALVLFFTVPTLTHSSLSDVGYWVDWVVLASVALGLGALVAVWCWPLLALLRSPQHTA